MQFFGIKFVGFNADNAKKLLFTFAIIFILVVIGRLLHKAIRRVTQDPHRKATAFWFGQTTHIVLAVILLLCLLSIWFSDPGRLAGFLGFVAAGLAVALQRVVTAVAGYFIILRNGTFRVGDRITMGGVRGDVVALGFVQTTIMEMGEPPPVQSDEPAVWVEARQYTGRLVTVTNDKIFDEPVYNFTREFPYIWEEIRLPITYRADRARAEAIILEATRRHTLRLDELGEEALKDLERHFLITRQEMVPRVYYRLTDNWIELSVRFLCRDFGVRALKDAMYRDILDHFEKAGLGIASSTYDIVGFPPIHLSRNP